ncbi:hypothetical protein DSUL_160078 [Desulfovibrionales bacterium]
MALRPQNKDGSEYKQLGPKDEDNFLKTTQPAFQHHPGR